MSDYNKDFFIRTLKGYGFIDDGEYDDVLHHPNERGILTWFDEDKDMMAISIDMEYTIYRNITPERLIALSELFDKD